MGKNIIDTISKDLLKLDSNPKLFRVNPKLYSESGIILEPYARLQRQSPDALKKLVKSNTFFTLGSTTIQTGLFSKQDKKVATIEWESVDVIKKNYEAEPDKIVQESSGSDILIQKMVRIITEFRSNDTFKPKQDVAKRDYSYPQEDRIKLYEKYFPEELEKYRQEGKHESNLEKKFRKKMAKGSEFYFSDGKVAHNLLTWVQCLHMAPNDVIKIHIKNNDFYNWLDIKVKAPELARICLMLSKQLEGSEISEKNVKIELLNELNNTSLNNIIFETLIQPLLRSLRSPDQIKAQDSIDKLLQTGDQRVVEPMIDKVLDSTPQIRRKLISGLGKLGDKRATPTLLKVLNHSTDAQDRLLAVKTLGILQDKRAIGALKSTAKNTDELGAEAKRVLDGMRQ